MELVDAPQPLTSFFDNEKPAEVEHSNIIKTANPRLHLVRMPTARKTLLPPIAYREQSVISSEKGMDNPAVDNNREASPIHIKRQTSTQAMYRKGPGTYTSFTTEDMDIFFPSTTVTTGESHNQSPRAIVDGECIARHKDEKNFVKRDRAIERRRSNSVGATDITLKPWQFPSAERSCTLIEEKICSNDKDTEPPPVMTSPRCPALASKRPPHRPPPPPKSSPPVSDSTCVTEEDGNLLTSSLSGRDSDSGTSLENSCKEDNKESTHKTVHVGSTTETPAFMPADDCHKIAHELLTTEKSYVNKLHLIDQVFHFKVIMHNRTDKMFPPDVIPKIFSNIKSIYQFHHDFLLPQLEARLDKWDEQSKIGDVIKSFAPFLKLYSEYIKNYDTASATITHWQRKSPAFSQLVEELQELPECGSLRLLDHMLGPIQRIPRYEMLLKDYQKHLPKDSPDKEDTEVALDLVVMAASHSNEAIRKIDKFRKLLEINESLIGEIELIRPGRELIKEGKITKLSGRRGESSERYLFLFNDVLLVCHKVINVGLKHSYKIKVKLDVEGMRLQEGDNMLNQDSFYVKGKQKSLELCASSHDEKVAWQTTLWNTIGEFTKKQLSRHGNISESLDRFSDSELGKRAPTWIRDKDTSMCMQCSVGFTNFRRRHHCRACGIVVCNGCSDHKAKLACENGHEKRVCHKCFLVLEGKIDEYVPSIPKNTRGILKVNANDPSVLSGYLLYSTDQKTWKKRWLSAREEFVLYFFKAHLDPVAEASLPLPGYSLEQLNPEQMIIKMSYPGKAGTENFFQADDITTSKRWWDVLSKLVIAELPNSQVEAEIA